MKFKITFKTNKIEKLKNFIRKKKEQFIYDTQKNKIKRFLEKNTPKLTKNVIFSNLSGYFCHTTKESIFVNALRLRGCDVKFLLCDGVCFACSRRDYGKKDSVSDWKAACQTCKNDMLKKLEYYNIKPLFASNYISKEKLAEFEKISQEIDLNEIYNYEYEGINIGSVVWQSFIRYPKGLVLDYDEVDAEFIPAYRAYFFAGLVATEISKNILEKEKPDNVLSSHSIYTDFAPIIKIAKKMGIKASSWVYCWEAYICYFFADMTVKNTYLGKMKEKNWLKLLNRDLSQKEKESLDNYFKQRYADNSEISSQVFDKSTGGKALKEKLGIDNGKKTVCLFCHINFDAAVDPDSMFFKTTNEWVIESIKHMIKNDSVNWIVRIHPAEIVERNFSSTYKAIEENFDINNIPPHIKILNCHEKINSKDIFDITDIGITLYGTIGIELPVWGKNAIIAGNSHYANKGFTIDVKTKEEYFDILDNINKTPSITKEQIELAKKYAFSFFVQRMIPLDFLFDKEKNPIEWESDMDISRMKYLLPEKHPIIDKICNGLINEDDVILDLDDLEAAKIK